MARSITHIASVLFVAAAIPVASVAACGGDIADIGDPRAAQSGPEPGVQATPDDPSRCSSSGTCDAGPSIVRVDANGLPDVEPAPPAWHVEWTGSSTPPVVANLNAVWGSGADDVYAVGDSTILHRVHGAWKWEQTAFDTGDMMLASSFWSVWGTGADDVFVGGDGLVLRSAGDGKWRIEILPLEGRVVGFLRDAQDGSGVVLAAVEGGSFVRLDAGGTWSVVEGSQVALEAATRAASGTVYAVGPSGQIHVAPGRLDAWTAEDGHLPRMTYGCPPPSPGLPCDPVSLTPGLLSVASVGTDVYAVGEFSSVVHRPAAGTWAFEHGDASEIAAKLYGVAASVPDAIWAVGDRGVLSSDGRGTWSSVDVGARAPFRGVWTSGRRDVYVVGGQTIVHRR